MMFYRLFSELRIYRENSKGFSLVELLVTVAIIGIIASIATLKLGVYLRQGKTTEAKVMLSNIYGNERTYFIEFQTYHYDLNIIGLDFNGKYLYNAGFASPPFSGDCPSSLTGCEGTPTKFNTFKICGGSFGAVNAREDCLLELDGSHDNDIKALTGKCVSELSLEDEVSGFSDWAKLIVESNSFRKYNAIACSDLGGEKLDVWSIDWRKNLIRRKDGTK